MRSSADARRFLIVGASGRDGGDSAASVQKTRVSDLLLTDVLHVFTKSWLRYPPVSDGSRTGW